MRKEIGLNHAVTFLAEHLARADHGSFSVVDGEDVIARIDKCFDLIAGTAARNEDALRLLGILQTGEHSLRDLGLFPRRFTREIAAVPILRGGQVTGHGNGRIWFNPSQSASTIVSSWSSVVQ